MKEVDNYEWQNYGDINFLEHGGCLVKKDVYPNCYQVIWHFPHLPDYKGRYKNPTIIAKCFIDISSWMNREEIDKINQFVGCPSYYSPYTEKEKMQYCVDLISYYGIGEFDPVFPEITECGTYGWTFEKVIVGKQIAREFLKEYGVPSEWRK